MRAPIKDEEQPASWLPGSVRRPANRRNRGSQTDGPTVGLAYICRSAFLHDCEPALVAACDPCLPILRLRAGRFLRWRSLRRARPLRAVRAPALGVCDRPGAAPFRETGLLSLGVRDRQPRRPSRPTRTSASSPLRWPGPRRCEDKSSRAERRRQTLGSGRMRKRRGRCRQPRVGAGACTRKPSATGTPIAEICVASPFVVQGACNVRGRALTAGVQSSPRGGRTGVPLLARGGSQVEAARRVRLRLGCLLGARRDTVIDVSSSAAATASVGSV